ncbi:hypothetical protein DUI87_09053 [Hirundo rustica rustica]|uniref:Uncharacterized protein n=1 Tax=Hirundo rustica rustica TaxID=333673 RepID=A0A3M0KL38_HIRRU|nr:hypothetical protein DUI87_09053 [Hirundo rustica rustica]
MSSKTTIEVQQLCIKHSNDRLEQVSKKVALKILTKTLENTSPNTNPRGTPHVTALHLDMKRLSTVALWSLRSLSATMQTIPYPFTGPSIKSMSLQFRDKDVVWDNVKCFAQVQVFRYRLNMIGDMERHLSNSIGETREQQNPIWRKIVLGRIVVLPRPF